MTMYQSLVEVNLDQLHAELATERRMTNRVLEYWDQIRGWRPMPNENDIDPEALSDVWDHCFLIQMRDLSKVDYNYTYLGTAIAEGYASGVLNAQDNPLASLSAAKLQQHYDDIIQRGIPVVQDGEFINFQRDMVKYRQCLLPLGHERKVESIFGIMRYKIFKSN